MRLALADYLDGTPVRECARRVGLRDHMKIHRKAREWGFQELHERARREQRALRKTREAEAILFAPSSRRRGFRSLIKATRLSLESIELLSR
jgi:hypothetical protein